MRFVDSRLNGTTRIAHKYNVFQENLKILLHPRDMAMEAYLHIKVLLGDVRNWKIEGVRKPSEASYGRGTFASVLQDFTAEKWKFNGGSHPTFQFKSQQNS